MSDAKQTIAARAGRELKDGQIINLGIGLPTLIANYVPEGVDVVIQTENGGIGVGPAPEPGCEDRDRANAGNQPITLVPGGSYFDSATSFAMIRGGHIDATFLGTLQVDEKGNIANWIVPGKMLAGMGGAMDLITGAKIVYIVSEHCSKDGASKLMKECTFPLTGAEEADVIITERALFRRTAGTGWVLEEVAAGYTLDGNWKTIEKNGNFLYPVHQLSDTFKGKFLDSLKRALRKQNEYSLFYQQLQRAYQTKWVVHCEPSMAKAEHVIKYLGQYTHRVAITNQRILNIDQKVTFLAKDYRDNAIQKPVTLDGVEFLRRFAMHILPRQFVRIRRYGIYNHTAKRNLALQFCEPDKTIEAIIKKQQPAETNLERFERLTGINPCICPICKKGKMVAVRVLPRIRSPDALLQNQLSALT